MCFTQIISYQEQLQCREQQWYLPCTDGKSRVQRLDHGFQQTSCRRTSCPWRQFLKSIKQPCMISIRNAVDNTMVRCNQINISSPTGPPVLWKNPNKKYTVMMKKFPSVTLNPRKSYQSEMLIKKRQIPLPNNPMAKTVVGLKVSPSFPEMMFPAA